jgi:hypothetical protein
VRRACLLLGAALLAAAAAAGDSHEGAVVGRVLFEDGSPGAGARLVFLPGGNNTTAGADGSYRIVLPAGSYTLRVSGGGALAETPVGVRAGEDHHLVVKLDRGAGAAPGSPLVAFVFLFAAMIAVAIGGFYVNRRMAESGIDINKSVIGGVAPRKPFRRRRRKARPPSP